MPHGQQLDVIDVVRFERFVAQLESHAAGGIGAYAQRVDIALFHERRDGIREAFGLQFTGGTGVGVHRGTRAEDRDGQPGSGYDAKRSAGQ